MTLVTPEGTLGTVTSTLESTPTAGTVAAEAATAAGVDVRLLDRPADLRQVSDLFVSVWRPGDGQPLVNPELMRALAQAGGYVAGAYDGDHLLGACVGFFNRPSARALHSHIAGVVPSAQGRAVGYALKTHQYAWAADLGLHEIAWTFDPMIARNAYFNIAKLGAPPVAYLRDFYGDMEDGLNVGRGSDRLLVSWRVAPTVASDRHETAPARSQVLLLEDVEGRPVLGVAPDPLVTTLVGTPSDTGRARHALAWRAALRETLGTLLDGGASVTGFTRDGNYVVTRP